VKRPAPALREIRIRTLTPNAPEPNTGNGLRFFVVQESASVIELDNRATDPRFRISGLFLSKLPNGRLANSAGQEFEIVPEVRQ